jgi:hypothetical protein
MDKSGKLQASAAVPPEKAPLQHNGEMEVQLHVFLSLALDGEEW